MNALATKYDEMKKIQFIETFNNAQSYLAAKILINISATLYGLKPATLLTFANRRDNRRNLTRQIFARKHLSFLERFGVICTLLASPLLAAKNLE